MSLKEIGRDGHLPASADGVASDPLQLWLAYVEQVARVRRLSDELDALRSSRSWRLTAPLRRLMAWLPSSGTTAAVLRPMAVVAGPEPVQDAAAPISGLPASLREWVSRTHPLPMPGKRLLIDVTEVDLEDLGAGIQRVTKRVLAELLRAPPEGLTVVPVRLAVEGHYCLAWRFCERFLGFAADSLGAERKIVPAAGDVFLGLDFCRRHAAKLGLALREMKEADVRVLMLVYDLLPLRHPQWFPPDVVSEFKAWLPLLEEHADAALCISETTRMDLLGAFAASGAKLDGRAVTIPLGADALWVNAQGSRSPESGVQRVLLVGTVEPRKGHGEVLDVFERLWANGHRIELVFAGRLGWHVEDLRRRIRQHPLYGRQLHWHESLDDIELSSLYASADLLLMASKGEGFGLPVAEAGHAGCRLLLRDLPVFREVAGDRARYFGNASPSLDEALAAFIQAPDAWPDPRSRPWPTWRDSGAAISLQCFDP